MLTDEKIEIFAIRAMNACGCKTMKTVVPFGTEVIPMAKHMATEIESAACSDRDARIAELEQRNRDLHEDVQRFKEHALSEKDARMALERELAEARKDAERWNMTVEIGKDVLRHPNNRKSPESVAAYMAAINKGYDMTHAIDEAIDAAMKGQQ